MQFEVKEYGKNLFCPFTSFFSFITVKFNVYFFYLSVLPKFSVKLKTPPYILKTDNRIKINITTRYRRDVFLAAL